MKIGVIGVGSVGGTLGSRWARNGHEVVFGVRRAGTQKVKSLLKVIERNARAASVSEAAAVSDVVVLATPWAATREAIEAAGDLRGKIVIDCTNPIEDGQLAVGWTQSGAEQVAEWSRGAKVVKAFNTTGWNNMANATFGGQRAAMFVCGDDPEARERVCELASELGFEACDAGELRASRYLEPLAMLWIHLAYRQGWGRDFAFSILKR